MYMYTYRNASYEFNLREHRLEFFMDRMSYLTVYQQVKSLNVLTAWQPQPHTLGTYCVCLALKLSISHRYFFPRKSELYPALN